LSFQSITGTHDDDYYLGLGYAHAHDRLVQMVLQRIVGAGRISELLAASPEALELDSFFRQQHFDGKKNQSTYVVVFYM
jgi:penicillin G amidase